MLKSPLDIIGVDCAVDPRNVGLCRARLHEGSLVALEVATALGGNALDERLLSWVNAAVRPLLALDAPLGWPSPLADVLAQHRAGNPLPRERNALFRRQSDDVVAERLKKRPLDVGADRIARTAHAALELLRELRWATGLELPLAWRPGWPVEASVIEVYPAGTLKAHGLLSSGYKGHGRRQARQGIVEALRPLIEVPDPIVEGMLESDHIVDAVVCAVAGADFLRGEVMEPEDLELARKEGWIWVRIPP